MSEYTVVVEQDEEGWFVATVPSLPGCQTQGKTLAEARDRIREAMRAYVSANALAPARFVAIERIGL